MFTIIGTIKKKKIVFDDILLFVFVLFFCHRSVFVSVSRHIVKNSFDDFSRNFLLIKIVHRPTPLVEAKRTGLYFYTRAVQREARGSFYYHNISNKQIKQIKRQQHIYCSPYNGNFFLEALRSLQFEQPCSRLHLCTANNFL